MIKRKIIIICCYGHNLNRSYQDYLQEAADYANENNTALVIVSGGFTQEKSYPNLSEAFVAGEFIKKRLFSHNGNGSAILVYEENSYTTCDNIKNSFDLVSILGYTPDCYEVVVFCDAIRVLNIKIIAEIIFKNYGIKINAHDLSPVRASRAQLLHTNIAALGTRFPFLFSLENRIRKIRAQYR